MYVPPPLRTSSEVGAGNASFERIEVDCGPEHRLTDVFILKAARYFGCMKPDEKLDEKLDAKLDGKLDRTGVNSR